MEKRGVVLITAILFCFALVVMRLADLMLINHGRLSAKARSQYTGQQELKAGRGKIFDRRGRELAVHAVQYVAPGEERSVPIADSVRIHGLQERTGPVPSAYRATKEGKG